MAEAYGIVYRVVADEQGSESRRLVLLTEAINEVQKHQFVTSVNQLEASNVSQIMKVMEE